MNLFVFGGLRLLGWLRVSDLDEEQGLDSMLMGSSGSRILDQLSLRDLQQKKWIKAFCRSRLYSS